MCLILVLVLTAETVKGIKILKELLIVINKLCSLYVQRMRLAIEPYSIWECSVTLSVSVIYLDVFLVL